MNDNDSKEQVLEDLQKRFFSLENNDASGLMRWTLDVTSHYEKHPPPSGEAWMAAQAFKNLLTTLKAIQRSVASHNAPAPTAEEGVKALSAVAGSIRLLPELFNRAHQFILAEFVKCAPEEAFLKHLASATEMLRTTPGHALEWQTLSGLEKEVLNNYFTESSSRSLSERLKACAYYVGRLREIGSSALDKTYQEISAELVKRKPEEFGGSDLRHLASLIDTCRSAGLSRYATPLIKMVGEIITASDAQERQPLFVHGDGSKKNFEETAVLIVGTLARSSSSNNWRALALLTESLRPFPNSSACRRILSFIAEKKLNSPQLGQLTTHDIRPAFSLAESFARLPEALPFADTDGFKRLYVEQYAKKQHDLALTRIFDRIADTGDLKVLVEADKYCRLSEDGQQKLLPRCADAARRMVETLKQRKFENEQEESEHIDRMVTLFTNDPELYRAAIPLVADWGRERDRRWQQEHAAASIEPIGEKWSAAQAVKRAEEEAARLEQVKARKAEEEVTRLAQVKARQANEEAARLAQEKKIRKAEEEATRLKQESVRKAEEEAAKLKQAEAREAKEQAVKLKHENAKQAKEEQAKLKQEKAIRQAEEAEAKSKDTVRAADDATKDNSLFNDGGKRLSECLGVDLAHLDKTEIALYLKIVNYASPLLASEIPGINGKGRKKFRERSEKALTDAANHILASDFDAAEKINYCTQIVEALTSLGKDRGKSAVQSIAEAISNFSQEDVLTATSLGLFKLADQLTQLAEGNDVVRRVWEYFSQELSSDHIKPEELSQWADFLWKTQPDKKEQDQPFDRLIEIVKNADPMPEELWKDIRQMITERKQKTKSTSNLSEDWMQLRMAQSQEVQVACSFRPWLKMYLKEDAQPIPENYNDAKEAVEHALLESRKDLVVSSIKEHAIARLGKNFPKKWHRMHRAPGLHPTYKRARSYHIHNRAVLLLWLTRRATPHAH